MLFSFNALAEPVNINKANAETIAESLKGIGIKKAEAIVKYRKKNGAFKSLADLSNVHGIGEKTLKNIAPDIGLSKGKVSKTSSAKKKIAKTANKKTKKKETAKIADKKAKKQKKVDKKKSKKKKAAKKKSNDKTK
jgi:competence protein ComEA